MSSQLSFIGAGNMARAIIQGLIASGHPPEKITATATREQTLAPLRERFAITTSLDNQAAVLNADVLVLAVKPQKLAELCVGLRDAVQQRRPLVLSVAAGIRCSSIERWLGGNIAVVRSMPNTPSLVGTGACGLYAAPGVSDAQRALVERLMGAVGITEWVEEEELLSVVTAIAGSAPAYFFYMIEALEKAGVAQGLKRDSARRLAIQTALGAAKMAALGEHDPETLKRQVMSPNGTTERAIQRFEAGGLEALVLDACNACRNRANELADQLDQP
ncbi:pyrroline-5-carboxylate reductase [Halotalea alkalilenta]|uniref:Pyrroline-5-carboxylate reductase n=1 Tax=Halotalea alkalilenta TaxID=376489 RepID=A0A172YA24_9GAMM|nr:pyrroline-5-carboxylate reductase [Halotalea alkalilenta]ANF56054.1 pyrroline-5-carboxylate reductase [Halotalea alkalilenta]